MLAPMVLTVVSVPAQAGIHKAGPECKAQWIPACAGMTYIIGSS